MRLDDFIPLARTVPEESKKYGARTCMAGYSPELSQLIRVYPVLIDAPIKSRHRLQLELTRNPDDNRRESFKLLEAEQSILSFGDRPCVDTDGIFAYAKAMGLSSIPKLNETRASLGFIMAKSASVEVVARSKFEDPRQGSLFDEFLSDAKKHQFVLGNDHDLLPYVTFWDAGGKHSLQIREWGAFEFLRRNQDSPSNLLGAYKTGSEREVLLLVGNMSHMRNVWMVLQLWTRQVNKQAGLFEEAA